MGIAVAIIVVVVCFGSLAIGFGRSMYRQQERRLQVKGKWSATPGPGGGMTVGLMEKSIRKRSNQKLAAEVLTQTALSFDEVEAAVRKYCDAMRPVLIGFGQQPEPILAGRAILITGLGGAVVLSGQWQHQQAPGDAPGPAGGAPEATAAQAATSARLRPGRPPRSAPVRPVPRLNGRLPGPLRRFSRSEPWSATG